MKSTGARSSKDVHQRIDLLKMVCRDSSPSLASRTHYGDVIMDAIASQITSLTIVNSIVYSDADQRKHQSSASLAFVRGIHRGPVNSPHKWPVTRKMVPFDDVIMDIPFCILLHVAGAIDDVDDTSCMLYEHIIG